MFFSRPKAASAAAAPSSPPIRMDAGSGGRVSVHITHSLTTCTIVATSRDAPGGGTCVVGSAPFSRRGSTGISYFEAVITSTGDAGGLGLGFVSTPTYDRGRMPGWDAGSAALHADDGKLYAGSTSSPSPVTPPFARAGATFGAGVNWDSNSLFFTVNGRVVGEAAHLSWVREASAIYPAVGVFSKGEGMTVSFSPPFKYVPAAAAPAPASSAAAAATGLRLEPPRPAAAERIVVRSPVAVEFTGAAGSDTACLLSSAALPPQEEWLATGAAPRGGVAYYELTLESSGRQGYIGVGVTCDPGYRRDRQPGWESNSVAVHADDGQCFNAGAHSQVCRPFSRAGVTVGVAVALAAKKVLFFVDGIMVASPDISSWSLARGVFAAVGLHSPGERVSARFVPPFKLSAASLLAALALVGVAAAPAADVPSSPPEASGFEPPRPTISARLRTSTAAGGSPLTCTFTGADGADAASIVSAAPVTPYTAWRGSDAASIAYFEVRIVKRGKAGLISVGYTSDASYSRNRHAGWEARSIGLHADDGRVFHECGNHAPCVVAPFARDGAVFGAAFSFAFNRVVFTVDGSVVACEDVSHWSSGRPMYAITGLRSVGEVTQVNTVGPFVASPAAIMAALKQCGTPARIVFESPRSAAAMLTRAVSPTVLAFTHTDSETPASCLSSAPIPAFEPWSSRLRGGVSFFEVTILTTGASGLIAAGFTSNRDYERNACPGWARQSIGLHADDGKVFHQQGYGDAVTAPFARVGAILGVAYGHASKSVAFFVDGSLVSHTNVSSWAVTERMYACVSLKTPGASVVLNAGTSMFRTPVDAVAAALGSPAAPVLIPRPALAPHVAHMDLEAFQGPAATFAERSGVSPVDVAVTRTPLSTVQSFCVLTSAPYLAAQDPVAYFEVTIVAPGATCELGIGYTSRQAYERDAQPGWKPDSIGLHFDDGKLHAVHPVSLRDIPESVTSPCTRAGAVVGVGILWRTRTVFFTVDGKLVARREDIKWLRDSAYGVIGMHKQGERVRANLNGPFHYNVRALESSSRLPHVSSAPAPAPAHAAAPTPAHAPAPPPGGADARVVMELRARVTELFAEKERALADLVKERKHTEELQEQVASVLDQAGAAASAAQADADARIQSLIDRVAKLEADNAKLTEENAQLRAAGSGGGSAAGNPTCEDAMPFWMTNQATTLADM